MHHPIQYQTIARIKQAEMLRDAAERRVVRDAQANAPRPAARWLAIALSLGVLVIGLALLAGMIWPLS